MKNKRAQIFAVYMVLMTLAMCGLALYLYYQQQKNVSNSFIYPSGLLELKEKQELFEIQERNLVIVSARETLGEEWNSTEFLDNFEQRFFNYILEEEQIQFREFLFSGLVLDEQEIDFSSLNEQGKINLIDLIYDSGFESDVLRIRRKPVKKKEILMASERDKINFVMDLDYVIEKEYLISKGDLN